MKHDIASIEKFVRAANYLTVTQIYLKDNFLLQNPLEAKDIKQRLFGHWGTCPGINFVYAHLNYFVKTTDVSTLFVLGPGHGFPALQANLFLEGTLARYYKEATFDEKGIAWVSKMFTWPYGVSSHSNPEAPGLILEGGELGYSLATAYGAILDNPDLLAVCMIGDGEAETGPIATSWHINKLIDPAINGAVLPILHVNGYKISGPTIFGRMSNKELAELFSGYGYEPFFVTGKNIYEDMVETLNSCYAKIKAIQQKARSGEKVVAPKFPMIILQTPKGWTGIKELYEKKVEGNILAHQVVAPNARKEEYELKAIEKWLASYHFEELFDPKTGFSKDITDIVPAESLRIGNNPKVMNKEIYKKLILPNLQELEKKVDSPGKLSSNSMRLAGEYLQKVFALNKKEKNFRFFSPDETYSNRLDAIFKETTRAFVWPLKNDDKDMTSSGRVMEMLSEHNLHGLAQGYILTGRHSVLTTYEAFAQIFSSMTAQYEKFLKVARRLPWRGPYASMNYILSSVLWRQEHNGFTHQNPSFITSILEKHDCNMIVYFPADDNSMIASLEEILSSKNKINVTVAGKTLEPRWVTVKKAKEALHEGLSVWEFASDKDPDIVLCGVGDYVTKEAIAALEMVKFVAPEVKIRFVNIAKLHGRCSCKENSHPQFSHAESYFTKDKPVIVNYHGYPENLEAMFLHVENPERFSVHGYQEQGGTTTPFDMHVRNKTSRYHLAIEIIEEMEKAGVVSFQKARGLINHYTETLTQHFEYITTYGVDPIELEEWHYDTIDKTMDNAIQLTILNNSKTIAIIGLSDDPDRYSNKVAAYLQSKGFKIVPINPYVSDVFGEKSYKTISDIPQNIPVDLVAIYRRSEDVFPHVKEAVKKGIKQIWLPEGVRNKKAEEFAQKHNILLVSDFCIMKEHQKLQEKQV